MVALTGPISSGPSTATPPVTRPGVGPSGSGCPGEATPPATYKPFTRLEVKQLTLESGGLPADTAAWFSNVGVAQSEDDINRHLNTIGWEAFAASINIHTDPVAAFAYFAHDRTLKADGTECKHLQFSLATAMKYASALATTFPINPKTKTSILDDPVFKILKSSLKVKLPAPTRFDMDHDLDLSYVWDYLDKDGSDCLVPNDKAHPQLIQLCLAVALIHDDQQCGADCAHAIQSGCHVVSDAAILLFSQLKCWQGIHEIQYEKNPVEVPHWNLWHLLQVHLVNWNKFVPEDNLPFCHWPLSCHL